MGLVAAPSLAGAAQTTRAGDRPTFEAKALDHIALAVTDVARSRDFYLKHLGLTIRSDNSPSSCFLNCGDEFVALFRHGEGGLDHYCYAIDDYDAGDAVRRLKAVGLKPRRVSNRVYFDDPDGNEVQVARPNRPR